MKNCYVKFTFSVGAWSKIGYAAVWYHPSVDSSIGRWILLYLFTHQEQTVLTSIYLLAFFVSCYFHISVFDLGVQISMQVFKMGTHLVYVQWLLVHLLFLPSYFIILNLLFWVMLRIIFNFYNIIYIIPRPLSWMIIAGSEINCFSWQALLFI